MHSNVVVLITADTIGKGDEELARILMRSFLKCLKEASPLPSAIHFLNRGVFLTTEGSDLLDDLRELAGQGVQHNTVKSHDSRWLRTLQLVRHAHRLIATQGSCASAPRFCAARATCRPRSAQPFPG